jgi:hypothetical protein
VNRNERKKFYMRFFDFQQQGRLALSVFPLTDIVPSFVGGEGRYRFRDEENKAKSSKLHLFTLQNK